MRDCRVLLVSNHPLFAEAITRLLQEENISVVAEVNDLEEARSVLKAQEFETIIVDQDDAKLQDIAVMSDFLNSQDERQVIFLSLNDNQMIIHYRERVENVTPSDLVAAIRYLKPNEEMNQ